MASTPKFPCPHKTPINSILCIQTRFMRSHVLFLAAEILRRRKHFPSPRCLAASPRFPWTERFEQYRRMTRMRQIPYSAIHPSHLKAISPTTTKSSPTWHCHWSASNAKHQFRASRAPINASRCILTAPKKGKSCLVTKVCIHRYAKVCQFFAILHKLSLLTPVFMLLAMQASL